MHEKENEEVYKDDLRNSFCRWFGEENEKQMFLSLLRQFSQKKVLLIKKSRLVGLRWFLFFLVIVSKSQISLSEGVSEENVKQHKYFLK